MYKLAFMVKHQKRDHQNPRWYLLHCVCTFLKFFTIKKHVQFCINRHTQHHWGNKKIFWCILHFPLYATTTTTNIVDVYQLHKKSFAPHVYPNPILCKVSWFGIAFLSDVQKRECSHGKLLSVSFSLVSTQNVVVRPSNGQNSVCDIKIDPFKKSK